MTELSIRQETRAAAWGVAAAWIAVVANTRMSQRTYFKVMGSFARWVEVGPEAVTALDVAMYKASMVARGLAPRTVRMRLKVLHSFYAWAVEHGYHPGPNPVKGIPLPRIPRKPVGRALDADQVAEMVAAARHARDRALLWLLAGAGLRATEAICVEERDVHDGDPPHVFVRAGKGGTARRVPLGGKAAAAVLAYLGEGERVEGATQPLFQHLDGSGRSISYANVYRIVTDCGVRAGLGHVAPHDLRRTSITLALDGGSPLPELSRRVGHTNMQQTLQYYRGG